MSGLFNNNVSEASEAGNHSSGGPCPGRLTTPTGPVARLFIRLALALMMALGLTTPAAAVTLVSNLGHSDTDDDTTTLYSSEVAVKWAQGFTAGSHSVGYTLSKITLAGDLEVTTNNLRSSVDADLYSATADDPPVPNAWIADLALDTTGLTVGLKRNFVFDAPSNTILESGTTYFIVISNDRSTDTANTAEVKLGNVSLDTEDDTPQAGWSILNNGHVKIGTAAWVPGSDLGGEPTNPTADETDESFLIKVEGDLRTASTLTVNSAEVTAAAPKELVITFSGALATDSTPDVSAFTVKVGGNAEGTPTNVSISGSTVTLTLATALDRGQSNVTVDYTYPGTENNPLKDASDNEIATFTDQAVTNNAPVCPSGQHSDQFWQACLTVATDSRGWIGFSGSNGALSDTEFTQDSTTYTIDQVRFNDGRNRVEISFTADTGDIANSWVLQIGNDNFDFRDRILYVTGSHTHVWRGDNLDWEVGDKVSLSLRKKPIGFQFTRDEFDIEEGDSVRFYAVSLAAPPSADVTVSIASSDTTAMTVSPASLTFTTTNWHTNQWVTVTAVEDTDGVAETVTLTHTASGVPDGTVTGRTRDNDADTPNPATNLRITDWNSTDGMTFEWDLPGSQPSGVVIESYILQYRVPSLSTNWQHFDPLAEDTSPFRIHTSDLYYDLRGSAPHDVRMVLESTDGGRAFSDILVVGGIHPPANLRLDGATGETKIPLTWDLQRQEADWLTINNVVVQQEDDTGTWNTVATLDTDATTYTVYGLTADTTYKFRVALATEYGLFFWDTFQREFRTADVGLTLSKNRVSVTEGSTTTYTVAVYNLSSGSVTVNIASSDPQLATVSPASLTFNSANSDTPQQVTVTGKEDSNTSDETLEITHSINGAQLGTVGVFVKDNDIIRLVIKDGSNLPLNIGEPLRLEENDPIFSSKIYHVKLEEQPDADVTVNIANSNPGAVTLNKTELTFTTLNWDDTQQVRVTAIDNSDKRSVLVPLTHTASGVRPRVLNVRVLDDEADTPNKATGLHTIQWHPVNGATLAWTLPATQPAGVTIEKVIVEVFSTFASDWVSAYESNKLITSWGWDNSDPDTFKLESGEKARVVMLSIDGKRGVSDELALDAPSSVTNLASPRRERRTTTIPLTWTLPTTQPPGVTVTGLEIDISEHGDGNFKKIQTTPDPLPADTTSYTVTGLTINTEYHFRVALLTNLGRAVSESQQVHTLDNEDPTGELSILGATVQGRIHGALTGDRLTVDVSAIDDPNGLSNPNWRYQWFRQDTNTTTLDYTIVRLAGATGPSYTVTAADTITAYRQSYVYVDATYTDDGGFTHTVTTPDLGSINTLRLASDAAVTTTEDEDYTFTVGDFNYEGTGSLTDLFARVRIISVETTGDLELNGTDVTAGTEVTKADLEGGNLIFKPAPSESGTPYATFTFRVSGTFFGDSKFDKITHRMTINVTSEPELTSLAVSSKARSGTATPKDTYGEGGRIRFTADFDEVVTVTGDPVVNITIGTNTRAAGLKRGSGTQRLVFEYTVVAADEDTDGISLAANALTLDDNDKIRNFNDADADVTHAAISTLSGHKVDGDLDAPDNEPPTSENASVTAESNREYTFAAADFPFMDEDAGDTFGGVKITTLESVGDLKLNGADVTLNQSVTKANIDSGQLTFMPAADGHGVGYATFGFKISDGDDDSDDAYTMTIDVRNVDVPVAGRPRASSASVEEKTLTVVFSEPIKTTVVPPLDRFRLRVNGQTRTLSGITIEADRVMLTLEEATIAGETVELNYDKPRLTVIERYRGKKVYPLQDLTGVEVESFTNLVVTNNSPPCPAGQRTPNLWQACLTIEQYSGLTGGYQRNSLGKLSPTAVLHSDAGNVVRIVGGRGSLVIAFNAHVHTTTKNWVLQIGDRSLNLSDANYFEGYEAYRWDNVNIWWNDPSNHGDKVSVSLRAGSADVGPILQEATVNGDTMELVFDEDLKTSSVPAGTAFTVQVAGSDRSLVNTNPVAVSGRTVTLTLASAVSYREAVTVAYTKPGSNPLEDAGGNDAGSFDATTVENETPNPAERTLVFTPANLTVPEGGSATYTVTLDRAPDSGNIITVSVKEIKASYRDVDKLRLSPDSFVLNASNWDTGQEITVTALRDGDGHDNRVTLKHGGLLVKGSFIEGYSSGTAHVGVTITDTNAPPRVANPIPNQTLVAGTAFSYTFPEDTFTDANGDPLSYSASRSFAAWPDWLTFDAATRTFSGTPGQDDTGFYQIYVRADDGVRHRAPYTQDMFYFRVYESIEAQLEGRRLPPAHRSGPSGSSFLRSVKQPPGGCRIEVSVQFRAPDGTMITVPELTAADFAVENGTIGTPVQNDDGWNVVVSATPGFTGLMRVRLLAREPAEVPESGDDDGESQFWETVEQVYRVDSRGEDCGLVTSTSLASLALEGMELDPAFDPDTYQYRVTVPNFVTSATLDAQAVYETATVSINREDDEEDVPGHQVALSNIFHVTISVTVGDETQSYYINGSPPPPDDALTGFELVDAATDADLGAIADGDTLSGSATGLYGFRAAVTPGVEIGSVVLTLSGPDEGDTHTQTEGLLPYSLYGDAPGGANGGRAEHGRVLAAGSYTLSATAYAGSGGAGDALDTRSVTFTVEGAATTLPASAGVLTGLVLVDASDNTDLGAIADGDTLSVSSDGTYGIRAGVGQTVGSVVLTLSGPGETDTHTQTESIAPYSLYGDEDDGAGGRTLNGEALPVGSYTLTATAYAERGGAGEVQGTLSVSFDVAVGLPGLSVADASAEEGTDEALEFVVTLDREATGTVTVSYTTEDGVATAPADYTTTSGTLTFAAGETTQTVSVPIVNDGHDEGSETMTLTLSGATGATITDDRATGTISNDGPIPEAWLARFGRTVTGQVLDAVETRLSATRAVGVEARLAGEALPSSDEAAASLASWLAPAEPDRGLMSQADAPGGVRFETRALTERDFLVGTSFAMTAQAGEGGGFASLWGNASVTGFDGRRANLTLDGEVTTGLIGVDWAADNRVAGLALGHSRGTGNYRDAEGSPGMDGKIEATLTGLYPYAGIDLTDRLSVWAAAGHGTGEVTVTPSGGADLTADLSMSMLAAGLRNEVLRPAGSGLSLAVKGDARFTRTSSDAVDGMSTSGGNLAAADADVWLLRAGIEGSQTMTLTAGATLTPSFGVGLRLDGGDAETGMGADIGGGLAFADPASGLTLDLKARGLLAHEASGFREWGASIAASWDPRPTTDRGPALSLTQTWGASPSGGMDALLSRETLAGLAADDSAGTFGAAGRLEGELGYGIAMFGGGFTGTPNVGFALSDGGAREWRVGWRLSPGGTARGDFDFGFSLDATRRDPAGGGAPEHAVALKGALRW